MITHLAGSIPIGTSAWPEFDQHRNTIIDVCLANEKPNQIESNIGSPIKTNLWESKFDFLQAHPELSALHTWMHQSVSEFVSNINKKQYHLAITESWAHVTRPGGSHGPHRHPYSTWSGIFYVDADMPDSGQNVFFNHFDMPKVLGYDFFEEQFEVNFMPGTLVLFPSTMMHYAKPYLGNDRRIVISFNSVVI
jgi:uncharacterized protein (TIGR02466 family)